MPAEKYNAASSKHLHDAELLGGAGRTDNAAYLSGYVAECALKALLWAQHGLAGKPFGHDIGSLSQAALSLAVILSPTAKRYRVPTDCDAASLAAMWEPGMRYQPEGAIGVVESEARLRAARCFHRELTVALWLDGVRDPQ